MSADRDKIPNDAVDESGAPVTVRHADIRRLLAYWREKRGAGNFPKRADIDPIDLRFMLDRIGLVEAHEGDIWRFRIRVAGSWWRGQYGFEPTGLWLDQWPNPEQRQLVLATYRSLMELRKPLVFLRNHWVDDRKLEYEAALLPMSEDGERISMILAGIALDEGK
jgi:hypothetical protein